MHFVVSATCSTCMWGCVRAGASGTRSRTLPETRSRWSASSLTSRFSSLSSSSCWRSSRVSYSPNSSLSNAAQLSQIIHMFPPRGTQIRLIPLVFRILILCRIRNEASVYSSERCGFTVTGHPETGTAVHMHSCAHTDPPAHTIRSPFLPRLDY